MSVDETRTAGVSREMTAPPEVAWALVSDVTRMPQWSPEATECTWVKGATGPTVGAKFKGSNEALGHSWNTLCRVTDCRPGAVFAFESTGAGMRIARWEYLFEPTEGGCRVTENWTDQRGWLVGILSKQISGVADRRTHNTETMTETLANLADAAEAEAGSATSSGT